MSSFEVPVLNVLPTPAAPWSGGVATQFRARVEAERSRRPTAVLYREGGGYRLEASRGSWHRALFFPTATADPSGLEDPAFEEAVQRAATAVRAPAVHFEGAGGFPIASLLRLTRAGRPVVLSLHDFALFCLRPHLAEQPAGQFCGYCEDRPRCTACLRQDWPVADDFQDRYRAIAAELLGSVVAIVYPSPFLQQEHGRLFPRARPRLQRVIAPATLAPAPTLSDARLGPPQHIALVGAVHVHKGARVFEDVVRRLRARDHRGLRISVLGGGDPRALEHLRALPRVSVRGYYRAGALGATLRREGVALALILSITPESYCLALDECLAAGVPVLAFDGGAIGERLRKMGGGVLVDPSRGAEGVLDALGRILDGRSALPVPAAAPLLLPTPATVAEAHLRLYADLGFTAAR